MPVLYLPLLHMVLAFHWADCWCKRKKVRDIRTSIIRFTGRGREVGQGRTEVHTCVCVCNGAPDAGRTLLPIFAISDVLACTKKRKGEYGREEKCGVSSVESREENREDKGREEERRDEEKE